MRKQGSLTPRRASVGDEREKSERRATSQERKRERERKNCARAPSPPVRTQAAPLQPVGQPVRRESGFLFEEEDREGQEREEETGGDSKLE
eukprot:1683960-Rhodomonas_salina.3